MAAPTGFARRPPKLAVSNPKSISPTSKQKQEKRSIGVTINQDDENAMIANGELNNPGYTLKRQKRYIIGGEMVSVSASWYRVGVSVMVAYQLFDVRTERNQCDFLRTGTVRTKLMERHS